jgi:hypothetical protein
MPNQKEDRQEQETLVARRGVFGAGIGAVLVSSLAIFATAGVAASARSR